MITIKLEYQKSFGIIVFKILVFVYNPNIL